MDHLSKELTKFQNETLDVLRRAKTPRAFTTTVKRLIADLGFSHFDITRIAGDDGPMDVVLSNVPESLIDTYFIEGLDKGDMYSEFISCAVEPTYYSDLTLFFSKCPFNLHQKKKTILAFELLQSYGFHDAYSFPTRTLNDNSKLVFSVQSEHTQPDQFRRLVASNRAKIGYLSSIACHLLDNADFATNESARGKIHLNAKQIAILEAMGKYSMTQQQAADYAGLTESTVKTYCKHIKEKLGKRTLSGAIYEALKLGIIAVE